MSIPVWKRKSNETLDLFMESMKFCQYILQITKNEKIFSPKFKVEITDRLNKDAIDIYTSLWKANEVSLKKFPNERRELQRQAQTSITDFLCVWCLAKTTFHLKTRRDKHVIDWITAIKTATSKWMNSDVNRLNTFNIEGNDVK